jgi:hypothetical protein
MQYLEVTTIIGCAGNCLKYCPQEIFLKRYGKDRPKLLALDNWHKVLHNIPPDLPIRFGDFSEPLAHPDFIEIAKMALKHGHKLNLFTTLCWATNKQVDALLALKFEHDSGLVVHIPDGKVFKTPKDPDYPLKLAKVLTNPDFAKVDTVRMDDNFVTSKREDILRCTALPTGGIPCRANIFKNFKPSMLPDGQIYPCCMEMGLLYPMGSLIEEDWVTITSRIRKQKRLSICAYCTWSLTRKQFLARKFRKLAKTILRWDGEEDY